MNKQALRTFKNFFNNKARKTILLPFEGFELKNEDVNGNNNTKIVNGE